MGHRRGFEDIAYDSRSGRFYVLIESLRRGQGKFMAAVQEYDANFRYIGSAWLDFPLDRPNKGTGRPDMRAPRGADLPARVV